MALLFVLILICRVAASTIDIRGTLAAAGGDGAGLGSGGGSGGSILIRTTNMSGYGVISVAGGIGGTVGYGGAGGRMALILGRGLQVGGFRT